MSVAMGFTRKELTMTLTTFSGRSAKKQAADTMSTERVFVTPDMAYDWLVHNTNNRHLRPQDVLYLKQCILSGNWKITHQGIAFYTDGELADGQHRLNAIADAGVGVWVNVTRNMPRENADAIDRGIPRTHRDHLQFSGWEVDTRKVAVCVCLINQYYVQTSENSERWQKRRLQPGQFEKFYGAFSDAIEFAYSTNKQLHACPVAAIASAWFTEDRDRLAQFKAILVSGATTDASDHAAVRLRDYLIKKQYGQGEAARNDLFLKSCSALRAFLDGRSLSKLYATNEHAFPLPAMR